MPGPIASAFVEITARLNLDSKNNNLETGLRNTIRRIEGDLEKLEGSAREAGAKVAKQLSNIRINLDVREALRDLHRVGEASDSALSELKQLQRTGVVLDTDRAKNSIKTIEQRIGKLLKSVQILDDQEIDLNVGETKTNLKVIDNQVERLVADLGDLHRARPDIDVGPAAEQLDRLSEAVNDTLRDLNRLEKKQVHVDVDMLELEKLESKVKALDGERIKIGVDAASAAVASNAIGRVENQAGDFSRAFRRILAFGAIREVAQVVSQLFQAGVRAAGAIQLVEVSLNRFFAQSRDLGETSRQFFGDLKTLAIETPFEFKDLAETSRRVLAMGEDAKGTVKFMTQLSDAVAAVGGGQGEIDGIVRALSQLSSKGKVDLQDFRQISENLPSLSRQMQIQGVIDELNELHPGLNATFSDFEKLRKSGLITGKVLRDGVIRAIGEIPGVAGAAKAASRTLEGALSNLADFATQEFASAFQGLGGIIADELNLAFGAAADAEKQLSPLALAVEQVLDAAGRAGESGLPLIFDAIEELAPDVADLVDALSELVDEALPALTNLSKGALTTFTGVAGVLREVVQLFNLLPAGLQQTVGQFVTLATIIPGAGESLKKPFVALKQELFGVEAGVKKLGIASSLAGAGVTAGVLVAVQILTSTFAKAAERNREFKDAIDAAADSLDKFATPMEAAVNFINKFREAGEGVDLGKVEEGLNGLTTPGIEKALGVNNDQLAALVANLSTAGASLDGFFRTAGGLTAVRDKDALTKALSDAGLEVDKIDASNQDAIASLIALSEQFESGAKSALDAKITSAEYVFVTDEVAQSIKRAAEKTGDYAAAQKKLEAANQDGAKAVLNQAKARGATDAQIQQAIEDNTTYTTGVDGLTVATHDYVGALQDLGTELFKQEDIFDGLTQSFEGFSDAFNNLKTATGVELGTSLVDFARDADEAGFSADELNAIANKLGDSLGQVLTGDELGKVFGALKTKFDDFKTGLEGVLPSIQNLQIEADGFSLDKFIEEIEKVFLARGKVLSNIDDIVNKFGELGSQAIQALLDSGLTGDTFAIAVQDLLKGGEKKIKEFLFKFGTTTAGGLEDVATKLAGAGFTTEEINKILNVDAFADGAAAISGSVAAAVESVNQSVKGLSPGLAALARADNQGPRSAAPTIPAIDVEAATASASSAGDKVSAAFTTSVQAGAATGMEAVTAGISTTFDGLAASLAPAASTAGIAAGTAFVEGAGSELTKLIGAITIVLDVATKGAEAQASIRGHVMGKGLASAIANAVATDLSKTLARTSGILKAFGDDVEGQMAATGRRAAFGFESGIDRMSERFIEESTDVLVVMGIFGVEIAVAALRAGSLFVDHFMTGVDPLAGALDTRLKAILKSFDIPTLKASAYRAGFSVGSSFADGFAAAIAHGVARVNAAATVQVTPPTRVQTFASGLVATRPTFGIFGESGPEALIPLSDGAAAARVIARLAPFLPSPGRDAAAQALGQGGPSGSSPGVVHYHQHTWNIVAPTEDPEALAMQVQTRIERRL